MHSKQIITFTVYIKDLLLSAVESLYTCAEDLTSQQVRSCTPYSKCDIYS